jgi:hypothetical protein
MCTCMCICVCVCGCVCVYTHTLHARTLSSLFPTHTHSHTHTLSHTHTGGGNKRRIDRRLLPKGICALMHGNARLKTPPRVDRTPQNTGAPTWLQGL